MRKRSKSVRVASLFTVHTAGMNAGPRVKPAEFSNLSSDFRTLAKSLNSLNLSFLDCKSGRAVGTALQ